jgi:integrase
MMGYKVCIEVFKRRLRLRWRYRGTRPTMALGLPDTPLARRIAEGKAAVIEADLITGNYDPTLLKYRSDSAKHIDSGRGTTVMLFQRFAKHGSADRSKDGAAKYASVLGKLQRFGSHTAEFDADTAESSRPN